MISVKLMGGLANKMFQIASTYAFAKDNGFNVGFDLSYDDLPLQGNHAIDYANNIFFDLPKINHKDYNFELYKEPRWEYTPIPVRDNLLLEGYFQSPKYFNHRREEILKLFLNDDYVVGSGFHLKSEYGVELNNSIGIHIRRGDYLKFPNHHPLPSLSYYMEAIRQLTAEKGALGILVFSDDMKWCKNNFNSPRIRFIEGYKDYEDLLLMSYCNYQVIANSSFSWWAYYLNTNKDKVCYAPKNWFGKAVKHGWDDIYLPEMRLSLG